VCVSVLYACGGLSRRPTKDCEQLLGRATMDSGTGRDSRGWWRMEFVRGAVFAFIIPPLVSGCHQDERYAGDGASESGNLHYLSGFTADERERERQEDQRRKRREKHGR